MADCHAMAAAKAEADCAHERAAHARTKLELSQLAAQHAALLAAHNGKQAVDGAQAQLRDAEGAVESAMAAHKRLAAEIRDRYSLTSNHVICPLTGAITLLGT